MTKNKCKHKWVDMEDGSLDRICVKCRKFAMQNIMIPSSINAAGTSALPLGRETMEVPFFNGSEHVRMEVFKDEIMKRLHRELGVAQKVLGGGLRNGVNVISENPIRIRI